MSNYADNILDKDGNPIYLEDKHLNDQTSQTTVATTDAVMLKDTNGAYHSIDKSSFNEAVRAAMGSILTNFDKGTSIARIPGIDSSNDLGSVTAANLASVLGDGYLAVSSTHELGNGDFNSFPNGLYFVAGNSFSNSPIDAVGDLRGFVRTESYANGSYKTQEFVSCNGLGNANGAHFSRALYNSVWTSWQRIDNYGTTSLSGLASLLGEKNGIRNCNKAAILDQKKARVAWIGNYQNALFLIRYGETSNFEVCNCKIVQINNRELVASFNVVAGVGSIPLYYTWNSKTLNLYIDATVLSYPRIDVILLSWVYGSEYQDAWVGITDASGVDFSTLRTVTI